MTLCNDDFLPNILPRKCNKHREHQSLEQAKGRLWRRQRWSGRPCRPLFRMLCLWPKKIIENFDCFKFSSTYLFGWVNKFKLPKYWRNWFHLFILLASCRLFQNSLLISSRMQSFKMNLVQNKLNLNSLILIISYLYRTKLSEKEPRHCSNPQAKWHHVSNDLDDRENGQDL